MGYDPVGGGGDSTARMYGLIGLFLGAAALGVAITGMVYSDKALTTGGFEARFDSRLDSVFETKFNESYTALNVTAGEVSPSTLSGSGNTSVLWTLPEEDGEEGSALTTDGNGTLSFVAAVSDVVETLNLQWCMPTNCAGSTTNTTVIYIREALTSTILIPTFTLAASGSSSVSFLFSSAFTIGGNPWPQLSGINYPSAVVRYQDTISNSAHGFITVSGSSGTRSTTLMFAPDALRSLYSNATVTFSTTAVTWLNAWQSGSD